LTGVRFQDVTVEVSLHVATLGSVLVLYGRRLWQIALGVLRRDPASLRHAGLLILASIPAGLIGVLFHRQIEARFHSLTWLGVQFVITGGILWWTRGPRGERELPTPAAATGIGVAQAFAILPAISRAGGGVAPFVTFRRLPSTLAPIDEVAAQQAPPRTAVIAEEQTAGRGRGGRTWHWPVGGVRLGMLLHPAHGELGVMSIRAGLVLADVVDELAGRAVTQLKWPNDVVVMDRKVAGILCEDRWQGDVLQWLGLGIGVNVFKPIPPEVADHAVALAELLPTVRRLDVLDRLVPALLSLTAHTARLTESECFAFGERDWLRG